jgi:hypothetical protein
LGPLFRSPDYILKTIWLCRASKTGHRRKYWSEEENTWRIIALNECLRMP